MPHNDNNRQNKRINGWRNVQNAKVDLNALEVNAPESSFDL